MKILFVLEHFHPYIGGAEKLFYVLTQALAKKGHEVVVVTTRFDPQLAAQEMHHGINILRVNCWNRFAFTFLSLPTVLREARTSSIIHTTTYNAALPAIIAGKLRRKPVFVTFHEVWGELWRKLPFTSVVQQFAFYHFEKLLLRLPFEKFIAVSEFTKEKLQTQGIPNDQIVRIYNGIDYQKYSQLSHQPKTKFTYTYFGRLGISKGLNLLIPAAAQFHKKFPDTQLQLIIPKQPKALFEKIMDLIKTHGLDKHVVLKHNLPKAVLFEELCSSSCVVIPSYSEGFCFAAAEAVALKIPIISSHCGALPEVVSGRYLVMEKMDVESLTIALTNAYHQNWQESPIRYFPLAQTEAEYLELYATKTD